MQLTCSELTENNREKNHARTRRELYLLRRRAYLVPIRILKFIVER